MNIKKTIIIAEAGVNHNGDLQLAKRLIDVAAEAKVDYVKFQTFKADKIVSTESRKAVYQMVNMADGDDSQYSMLKKLEMPEAWHYELKAYAEGLGIRFLSTGFDIDSVDFLDALGIDFFKIPSGEITNKPYLEHIARKQKPVVLSTGMSSMHEVREAVEVLEKAGLSRKAISVLHCNTEYPTPYNDVNLKAMITLGDELGVAFGYSDHTLGTEVPIAAVAMGASILEKHFTLNRDMPGPDHKASLEPSELISMVTSIRNIELALSGSGIKEPTESERKNISLGRKSLFFKNALPLGHVVSRQDFIALRPGSGISPMQVDAIVGLKLTVPVASGTMVSHEQFIQS
jgi:N,N'-diacetyllegionaminate synthase